MVKYIVVLVILLTLIIKTPLWISIMTWSTIALLGLFLLQDALIKPLWRKRQRRLTAEANAKAMKEAMRR